MQGLSLNVHMYVNMFLFISTFWHECSMKTLHALNIYVQCEYIAMYNIVYTYTMGKVKETTHFFAFVVGAPPSYLCILNTYIHNKAFCQQSTESLDLIKKVVLTALKVGKLR